MAIFLLFGLVQALFFGIIVMAKKRKDTGDYMLAVLFLILAYEFWVNWIFMTGRIVLHPHFFGTALPLVLLVGPLLFFYIKIHISIKFRFKAVYLWHVVPYLILIIIYLPFYSLNAEGKIIEYQNLVMGRPSRFLSGVLIVISLSPIIYTVWSLIILKRHRQKIPDLYSYASEKMKLDWLWYLTWSMLIVSVLALLLNTLIAFSDIFDWIQLRLYVLIFSVIWVFSLGFYGIRRTSFFQAYPLVVGSDSSEMNESELERKKYERTKISPDSYRQYKKNCSITWSAKSPI